MVDRARVLVKVDELKGYLKELRNIAPKDIEQYRRTPTKRACERLLQLCIECAIDICKKLVIGNRLGVPQDEVDVFEKLKQASILSENMLATLKQMRALRNVLVHEYADIDDTRVFEVIAHHLDAFDRFQKEILAHL